MPVYGIERCRVIQMLTNDKCTVAGRDFEIVPVNADCRPTQLPIYAEYTILIYTVPDNMYSVSRSQLITHNNADEISAVVSRLKYLT